MGVETRRGLRNHIIVHVRPLQRLPRQNSVLVGSQIANMGEPAFEQGGGSQAAVRARERSAYDTAGRDDERMLEDKWGLFVWV